jgi:hypothetical protein
MDVVLEGVRGAFLLWQSLSALLQKHSSEELTPRGVLEQRHDAQGREELLLRWADGVQEAVTWLPSEAVCHRTRLIEAYKEGEELCSVACIL